MNTTPIMRAKLRAVSVVPSFFPKADAPAEKSMEELTFCGVAANSYPADGLDENNSFAKWSPSVDLKITVANPALFGAITQGDEFYVDFTRAGVVGGEGDGEAGGTPARPSMTFGHALEAMKAGRRVSRDGWNGKGMFAYLVPAASYPVQTGAAKAHFGEGSMVPYNAYLALKTVNDTVSTWVPSVNDCLAEDWNVLD